MKKNKGEGKVIVRMSENVIRNDSISECRTTRKSFRSFPHAVLHSIKLGLMV